MQGLNTVKKSCLRGTQSRGSAGRPRGESHLEGHPIYQSFQAHVRRRRRHPIPVRCSRRPAPPLGRGGRGGRIRLSDGRVDHVLPPQPPPISPDVGAAARRWRAAEKLTAGPRGSASLSAQAALPAPHGREHDADGLPPRRPFHTEPSPPSRERARCKAPGGRSQRPTIRSGMTRERAARDRLGPACASNATRHLTPSRPLRPGSPRLRAACSARPPRHLPVRAQRDHRAKKTIWARAATDKRPI